MTLTPEQREALELLRLILPMARAYAFEHPVGKNKEMIAEAESYLAQADAPTALPADAPQRLCPHCNPCTHDGGDKCRAPYSDDGVAWPFEGATKRVLSKFDFAAAPARDVPKWACDAGKCPSPGGCADAGDCLFLTKDLPPDRDALVDDNDPTVLTPAGAAYFQHRGNSVAHWIARADARGLGIDRAWQAMKKAGHPPDGRTPLHEAIAAALAQRDVPRAAHGACGPSNSKQTP